MRRKHFITLLTMWALKVSAASSQELLARVSTIDLTPPLEMKYTLGGYGERMNAPAEGIHDPIFAKALVLSDGKQKYAIVTLDLLGIPSNLKPELVRRVSDQGWAMENILLLPSHSHGSLEMAALNSNNLLNSKQIGIFHPELLEFVVGKLEALMRTAGHDLNPVSVGTQSRIVDGLNRNRRKDPEVDRELIVTRIDHADESPMAVLVNWTAHPTFISGSDMQLSAEWPGYLQSALEREIGNGVTAMFYNGAVGDQSVLWKGTAGPYQKIQEYGKELAARALDIYREIKPLPNALLRFHSQRIKLPSHAAHPSFLETGGAEYGITEETVKIVMRMICPVEAEISALRLGELVIAGVPGELTAPLGLNVKEILRESGAKYPAIGGLANEWIGYILTSRQYDEGGGYEASVSFYGAGLGELIRTKMLETATSLVDKK